MEGTITWCRHDAYPSHAAYLAAFITAIVFIMVALLRTGLGAPTAWQAVEESQHVPAVSGLAAGLTGLRSRRLNFAPFCPVGEVIARLVKNGRKKCQMTCKPGSVTAAIAADDGYSSRMAVTSHLKQPTRT